MRYDLLFCSIILQFSSPAVSQVLEKTNGAVVPTVNTIYLNDLFKEPYKEGLYADINGSPYLNEQWQSANILLKNGREFQNARIKLNLHTHEIIYLSTTGKEIILQDGIIQRVTIFDTTANGTISTLEYVSALKGAGKDKENAFYEIITEGKASLLRLKRKKIVNNNNALSPGENKEFVSAETYCIWNNDQHYNLEKNPEFYLKIFADQQEKISDFIRTNKLKCGKTEDIIKLVEFYNNL